MIAGVILGILLAITMAALTYYYIRGQGYSRQYDERGQGSQPYDDRAFSNPTYTYRAQEEELEAQTMDNPFENHSVDK